MYGYEGIVGLRRFNDFISPSLVNTRLAVKGILAGDVVAAMHTTTR